MNLFLFISILFVSFVVVRIGAVAFQLTGLEWSLAKFQALSCFTGTGFTTREAELVTSHPQRRRIAAILMVMGNAGLVTLIATFANSLRPVVDQFDIPWTPVAVPARFVPWFRLGIILIAVYGIYFMFTFSKISRKLTETFRSRMIKNETVKPVSFEELVVATGGYGVSSIHICDQSPIVNKSIRDSGLRKHDISILSIEHAGEVIPNPSPDVVIHQGDKVICFGKLEKIRTSLCYVPVYSGSQQHGNE